MSMPETIFAVVSGLAMVGGFIFEWRRQSAQDGRLAAVEERLGAIDGRVTTIEQRCDRIGRLW